MEKSLERKKFQRKKLNRIFVLALSFAALVAVLGLEILSEVWFCRVRKVEIETDRLPEGSSVKIVQISDIHNRMPLNFDSLSRKIGSFSPHFIALTGDMIDRKTVARDNALAWAVMLAEKAPVYFVRGNHEIANAEGKIFLKELSDLGIRVLINSSERIYAGSEPIFIAGADDLNFGSPDITKAEKGMSTSEFVVLLSHTPEAAFSGSEESLILSGHTHGGQVRLPFYGPVFIPDRDIASYMVKGLSEIGLQRFLYVDIGVGTSVIPVRLFAPSGIAFIEIKGK